MHETLVFSRWERVGGITKALGSHLCLGKHSAPLFPNIVAPHLTPDPWLPSKTLPASSSSLFPSRSSTSVLQGSALRAWTSVHVVWLSEDLSRFLCFFFFPSLSLSLSSSLDLSFWYSCETRGRCYLTICVFHRARERVIARRSWSSILSPTDSSIDRV